MGLKSQCKSGADWLLTLLIVDKKAGRSKHGRSVPDQLPYLPLRQVRFPRYSAVINPGLQQRNVRVSRTSVTGEQRFMSVCTIL